MKVTPFEILKTISDSPPFQRTDVIKNYIDLSISDWTGELSQLDKTGEDSVSVILRVKEGWDSVQVVFESTLSKYPELRILNPRQKNNY